MLFSFSAYSVQKSIQEDFTYDTSKVEAFLVPAGTAVEIYATTLHYAPFPSVYGQALREAVAAHRHDTDLYLW